MILTPDGLRPLPLPQLHTEALNEMVTAVLVPQLHSGLSAAAMQELLEKSLPQVLQKLSPALRETLLPALETAGLMPGDRLVLVPDDLIGVLPLHAVPIGPDGSEERLGDRYEVCYTAAFRCCRSAVRRKRPEPTQVFGLIDPTRSLKGPALEAELARRYFAEVTIPGTINHETLLQGRRRPMFSTGWDTASSRSTSPTGQDCCWGNRAVRQ